MIKRKIKKNNSRRVYEESENEDTGEEIFNLNFKKKNTRGLKKFNSTIDTNKLKTLSLNNKLDKNNNKNDIDNINKSNESNTTKEAYKTYIAQKVKVRLKEVDFPQNGIQSYLNENENDNDNENIQNNEINNENKNIQNDEINIENEQDENINVNSNSIKIPSADDILMAKKLRAKAKISLESFSDNNFISIQNVEITTDEDDYQDEITMVQENADGLLDAGIEFADPELPLTKYQIEEEEIEKRNEIKKALDRQLLNNNNENKLHQDNEFSKEDVSMFDEDEEREWEDAQVSAGIAIGVHVNTSNSRNIFNSKNETKTAKMPIIKPIPSLTKQLERLTNIRADLQSSLISTKTRLHEIETEMDSIADLESKLKQRLNSE